MSDLNLRRDYWLALEHDSLWGDHLMPLTVWVGPEAKVDEGLVTFGSTHGNEYEGPVALKHLLGEIKIEDVRGRIILIPVLNSPAFKEGTRETMHRGFCSRVYLAAGECRVGSAFRWVCQLCPVRELSPDGG